jgi:hypothetical protein
MLICVSDMQRHVTSGEAKSRASGHHDHDSEDDSVTSAQAGSRPGRPRRGASYSASSEPVSKLRASAETGVASGHGRTGRTGFTALMRAAHGGDIEKVWFPVKHQSLLPLNPIRSSVTFLFIR